MQSDVSSTTSKFVRTSESVRRSGFAPVRASRVSPEGIDHVGVWNLLHGYRLAQAEDAVGIRERDVLDVGYRIVSVTVSFAVTPFAMPMTVESKFSSGATSVTVPEPVRIRRV